MRSVLYASFDFYYLITGAGRHDLSLVWRCDVMHELCCYDLQLGHQAHC